MRRNELSRLSDGALLRALASLVSQDRATLAVILLHIAEVDARQLYLPLGYGSMHAYCVEALHFSDDAAYKRIHAARAARRFPALLDAVAAGRLHLSAVCLIAPHLLPANFDELVALATHRRKHEIERALVEKFAAEWWTDPPAQGRVTGAAAEAATAATQLAPGQVAATVPAPPAPPARTVRIELTPALDDKLRRAQGLLAHAVPTGNLAEIFDRALDALIAQVEGRKFGRTSRPRRRATPGTAAPRTVPARVRRAVAARDEDRCAFIGAGGHRCTSRHRLEFDHVRPLARGGAATEEGMRLLCRAHNQYEARRAFGAEFMDRKRREREQEAVAPTSNGSGDVAAGETSPGLDEAANASTTCPGASAG